MIYGHIDVYGQCSTLNLWDGHIMESDRMLMHLLVLRNLLCICNRCMPLRPSYVCLGMDLIRVGLAIWKMEEEETAIWWTNICLHTIDRDHKLSLNTVLLTDRINRVWAGKINRVWAGKWSTWDPSLSATTVSKKVSHALYPLSWVLYISTISYLFWACWIYMW